MQDLAASLAAAAAGRDVTSYRPVFHDAAVPAEAARIVALAGDPAVVVIDTIGDQLEELVRSRAPAGALSPEDLGARVAEIVGPGGLTTFGAWVHYPWCRRLVHVLPVGLHRELRFDRNRYKITSDEQARLLSLKIAIAGLSVGRAIVSAFVHEGIGGELRLADFDALSLSNLNRVVGDLADLGVNKAVLAAREAFALDPYLEIRVFERGVEESTLAEFVDTADLVIDECDDLAIKLRLREKARAARRPLLMATSDRGMLDVERFDLEPDRLPFHGMLEGIGSEALRGLTMKEKVPYVLRILDAEHLEGRTAASLIEVKETVSTWPQLASDVILGGAMVANAARRIALGELRTSGRFFADLDRLVAPENDAPLHPPRPLRAEPALVTPAPLVRPRPPTSASAAPTRDEMRFVVDCATRAPSGGNAQPWRFEATADKLRAFVDPRRSVSLLNFGERATFLALGAALEAALIGAAALGFDAKASRALPAGAEWELTFRRSGTPRGDDVVHGLLERCSNRRTEASPPIAEADLDALARAGAPLDVLVQKGAALAALGAALGSLDRVRFLSPRFRRELFAEVRWTREDALATRDGIDVASLELDAADQAVMDVLGKGRGMELLARLGHGRALGHASRAAFGRAGGALVLRARATDRASVLEAGRGLMRLWLEATRLRIAVHPWGSPFLFQRLLEAPASLEPWEQSALREAAEVFGREAPLAKELPTLLVLRLSKGAPPSGRSVRRAVDDVLAFV